VRGGGGLEMCTSIMSKISLLLAIRFSSTKLYSIKVTEYIITVKYKKYKTADI